MKNPKQLVFVRHGQTGLNVARARSPIFFATAEDRAPFIGLPDHRVPLTEKGQQQARETGNGLWTAGFRFTQVYDSGYVRTEQTLDLVLEKFWAEGALPANRKHSILIREREAGYAYCMTGTEVQERFPWFQEYWQTLGPVFGRPLGGESVADVIARVKPFLEQLGTDENEERVLVVTHGRVMAAVRYLLENWTYDQLEKYLHEHGCRNCGVTVYERNQKTGQLGLKEYDTTYY